MPLMDLSSPGIRIGTPDIKTGRHGQITADIVFDDVAAGSAIHIHRALGFPRQVSESGEPVRRNITG